jgi:hypothetical protein
MLKRKPNFYTFLATVVVVGLIPLAADADPNTNGPVAESLSQFLAQAGQQKNLLAQQQAAPAQQAPAPAAKPAPQPTNWQPQAAAPAPTVLTQTISTSQAAPTNTPAAPAAPIVAPVSASQANTPSVSGNTSTAPAGPSPAKPLTGDEAQAAIQDLSIKEIDTGSSKSAYLTGLVPAACADSSKLEVDSSANNTQSGMNVGATQGFSIQDKGGFLSCVQDAGGCKNGYSDHGTKKCIALSGLAAPIVLPVNSTASISVGYLNAIVSDDPSGGGNWAIASAPASVKLLSQQDIDAAAKKKAQQDLAKKNAADSASIVCYAKSGDFGTAYSMLEKSSIDNSDRNSLEKQLSGLISTADKTDLNKVIKDCQADITNNSYDKFDTCASNLDDYFSASDLASSLPDDVQDTESANRCKLGASQAVDVTNQMAMALTTQDGVGQDQIDHATQLLKHLTDSDSGMGCDLSAADTAKVNVGLKQGVVSAEAQLKYGSYMKSLDSVGNGVIILARSSSMPQGAELPLSATSCAPASTDPTAIQAMIDVWKNAQVYGVNKTGQQVREKGVESACKAYLASALADAKDLSSSMKTQKCVTAAGDPVDNPSSACNTLSAFQDQLSTIPANMAAMHQQAIQNQQAVVSSALAGLSGQTAATGMYGAQQTAGAQLNPGLYGQQQQQALAYRYPTVGANYGAQSLATAPLASQGAVWMPQSLVNPQTQYATY